MKGKNEMDVLKKFGSAATRKRGGAMKKVVALIVVLGLVGFLVQRATVLMGQERAREKDYAYNIDRNLLYTFLAQGLEDSALGLPYKSYPIDVHDFHATLVEYPFGSSPRAAEKNIFPRGIFLYVHGFSDYFFQKELAEKADSAGYAFFAVDLHGYGRSIAGNLTRSDMSSVSEHYTELDYALQMGMQLVNAAMKRASSQMTMKRSRKPVEIPSVTAEELPVILMGHSQGGLISSLYANDRPDINFKAVVLNSPFLEMNYGAFLRKVGMPVVALAGLYLPAFSLGSTGNPNYANSLYKDRYGEWDYNTDWKPFTRPVTHLRWVRAIYKGQSRIRAGIQIQAPVLVMHSACSIKSEEWVDEYTHCDGVLNADDIKELAPHLGTNVTTEEIEGGLHDLFLSKKDVRDVAYETAFKFIEASIR